MLIMMNSCSAAGQGFYKIFCPSSKRVCLSNLVHEANLFIIKYLRVLHSKSWDWRFWSVDHGYSGEMCERFYISYCFEAKKAIGSLKVKTANNVITLLFYILT